MQMLEILRPDDDCGFNRLKMPGSLQGNCGIAQLQINCWLSTLDHFCHLSSVVKGSKDWILIKDTHLCSKIPLQTHFISGFDVC